jgi:GT2 family glycosyltransferase
MFDVSHLVQIGITTKDRWSDLQITLESIKAFGLGDLSILIFDDGSKDLCPFQVEELCPGAELYRFEESAGYITRRNEIAQRITAKYYLSLDDDSFPVAGSLAEALAFFEKTEKAFCLTFPIYNPRLQDFQVASLHSHPYPVRAFIGCGHLLNRELFLQHGGYRPYLVRFKEESDLSARMFIDGYRSYHYPQLLIHHTETRKSRNWWAMDFYGTRNIVLWNDWYVPDEKQLVKQTRSFLSRIQQLIVTRRLSHIEGQFAGFREIKRYKENRQRMSTELYQQWRELPEM